MFKTITVFEIADAQTRSNLSTELLSTIIAKPTIVDPGKTSWVTQGFSKPEMFGSSPVFVGAMNARLFNVQIRERVLPGKVIRTHLADRVADIEDRQGRRCGRKEIAGMKDEVIASLLPTAFIKPTDILCMVIDNYVVIGTGSARLVDTTIEVLRNAYYAKNLPLVLRDISVRRNTHNFMSELLLEGSTDSGVFTAGTSVALRSTDKRTARFKDMELASQFVSDSVTAGLRPIEIGVTYRNAMSFSLTDHMLIKRIKFSDVLIKQAEDDTNDGSSATLFDATVALVAGELRGLLDTLTIEIPVASDATEDDEL